MPPAMAGPGPSIDPPRASTPFTVLYSRTVSKSQMTLPSVVEYARRCPSTDPENAAPGIALTAADCAGLQRLRSPQENGGVYQTFSPVLSFSAYMPPPWLGSASVSVLNVSMRRLISDTAT